MQDFTVLFRPTYPIYSLFLYIYCVVFLFIGLLLRKIYFFTAKFVDIIRMGFVGKTFDYQEREKNREDKDISIFGNQCQLKTLTAT